MASGGRQPSRMRGVAGLLSAVTLATASSRAHRPKQPHIMFVVSDDLRPTLGSYGTQAISPNVDALAARGTVFTRAYTQFPWCSPTRNSFLSGRRPDTTKAWTFTTSFRDAIPDAISLPQHFRRQGWYAVSVGKIYHGRNCVRGDPGCCPANATFAECVQQPQDADWAGGSWDEHPVDFKRVGCAKSSPTPGDGHNWCGVDGNESAWCDYQVAFTAMGKIRAHAEGRPGTPLFLGVGFRDNHLPWAAPPEWRSLFEPHEVNATARGAPPDFSSTPLQAWQYPAWVGHEYNLSDTKWLQYPELQEALRSYMSNIAFTDHQLGKIMGVMEEVGFINDTIVLFTGDHGQNLGEHNTWCKMTAWEHSLRVPLIIAVPWLPLSHGQMHSGMAEMIDFYRTLSDLAGIDPASVDSGVEGDSLAPVFADPAGLAGKPYAFSQTQRIQVAHIKSLVPYKGLPAHADSFYDPSCFSHNSDIEWMGYSVRSSGWRFTEWLQWDGAKLCPMAPNLNGSGGAGVAAHATTCSPLPILNGTCWHDSPSRLSPPMGATTPALCCDECIATPSCAVYVFTEGHSRPCNLFSTAAPPIGCRSNLSYVAGTVNRPPVPPPPASKMIELYDHRSDVLPLDLDAAEYDNVADDNPDVVRQLRAVLLEKVVKYCST